MKKFLSKVKHFNYWPAPVSYSRYAAFVSRLQGDVNTCAKSFFGSSSSSTNPEDAVKKRQAELMARGLPKKKAIPGVRDVVLVVSGKGGVGKSTTAVNLAAAIALEKPSTTGLLDADVFGPSIPLMMNLGDITPEVDRDNRMMPLVNYGVKCMSMGFLVNETSAVVWRGLMVMKALEQMTRQVDWSNTDCLVVDTPPGTGDTILSIVQTIPVSGIVLVTTPEKLAVQVARRGASLFQKVGIPIIGIVSNMSSVVCSNCHNEMPIFGCETRHLASDLGVPILADMPLYSGKKDNIYRPAVVEDPGSPHAKKYVQIARTVEDFLRKPNASTDHDRS